MIAVLPLTWHLKKKKQTHNTQKYISSFPVCNDKFNRIPVDSISDRCQAMLIHFDFCCWFRLWIWATVKTMEQPNYIHFYFYNFWFWAASCLNACTYFVISLYHFHYNICYSSCSIPLIWIEKIQNNLFESRIFHVPPAHVLVWIDNMDWDMSSRAFETMLHEIGKCYAFQNFYLYLRYATEEEIIFFLQEVSVSFIIGPINKIRDHWWTSASDEKKKTRTVCNFRHN